MDVDLDILRSIFASRVQLAKRTEEEAGEDAKAEWRRCQAWVKSNSAKEKSFVWFCDYFEFEPDAVRRAIVEKRT
jgi:hypothetical protein